MEAWLDRDRARMAQARMTRTYLARKAHQPRPQMLDPQCRNVAMGEAQWFARRTETLRTKSVASRNVAAIFEGEGLYIVEPRQFGGVIGAHLHC